MNLQIKEIALRLKGLREALELSTEEIARKCNISTEQYEIYESGNSDISMSFLFQLAKNYGIDTIELLSGEAARSSSFFVTRKGTGVTVERRKAYKYLELAYGFKEKKIETFEVTVEPNNNPITLNSHTGQEFNLILEGVMQIVISGNEIILEKGDSIYFDASKPHGMKALNNESVKFLAVII
ncbi:Transcriptional regulator [uncultured Paludibacter sp.]|nr:Transcriptional regulator [uncultured Paludibacter sp.]